MTIDEMIEALERMRDQIEDVAGLTRAQAGKIEVRCAHQPRHPLNGAIDACAALRMGGRWIAMLGMGREEYGGGEVWERDGEAVDVDAEHDERDTVIGAEYDADHDED